MLKNTFALLLLIVTPASLAGADTLSVVPLVNALQNSDFLASDSEKVKKALENTTKLLLNQPVEAEIAALTDRLRLFPKHANSLLGKVFFKALANTPDIENLNDAATTASIEVVWPLELDAKLMVRVKYIKTDTGWLIEDTSVQMLGTAASAIASAGPYFSKKAPNPELLDKQEIGYLFGQQTDHDEFDFEATLDSFFAVKAGDYKSTLETLVKDIRSDVSRDKRLNTMLEHLITPEEREALKELDADDNSLATWAKFMARIKESLEIARPAAFSARSGTRIMVTAKGEGLDELTVGQRLESGKIGIRAGSAQQAQAEKKSDDTESESD
ncbi:MAG: hypothetical protein ACYTDT_08590 [Planctomycetota bacterium]|jgi:hypothetical protein